LPLALLTIGATTVPAIAAAGSKFPPFDASTFAGQLFWLAVTFGALYLLMSRVALPRVASILEERRSAIDEALKAAEIAQKKAEEEAAALEASLVKARTDAQAIAQKAKAKSAADLDAKRAKEEASLAADIQAAEARISDMKTKAMANVEGIAGDVVGAIVEQLAGKAPTAAAAAKAVAGAKAS